MGKPNSPKPNAGGKMTPKKNLKALSPNKGAMNGKGPTTPKGTPKIAPKDTPKIAPKGTPKFAPKNTPGTPNNTPINKNVGSAKKMKRSAEEVSSTPAKKQKLQMFSGTGLLESGNKQKPNVPANQNTKPSPNQNRLKNDNFKKLREILQKGGKEANQITQKLKEKLADNSAHSDDLSMVLNATHIHKLLRIESLGGKQNDKQNNKQTKKVVADESDDSEYDVESTIKIGNDEEESNDESVGEEGSDDESDEEIDSDGQVVEEEGEENSDEEGSDDDEDVEGWSGSEDDEDEKPTEVKTVVKQKPEPKKKQQKEKPDKSAPKQPGQKTQTKEKRYVVFVGNLPYTAHKDDIETHFSKAGTIKHVRIPHTLNKKKGFGFVEFSTSEEYEKALSLNHTFLKGRRINVIYSEGKKNKKSKAKGLKMAALQTKGILKGSVAKNKKRSQRRNKQKAGKDAE